MNIEVEAKRWNSIYPLYINNKFTVSQGRKTTLLNSVENPTILQIKQALDMLKIPNLLENNKRHPRDFFNFGRLKYKLKNEENIYFNESIKSKKVLLIEISKIIKEINNNNNKNNNNLKRNKKK